MCCGGALFNVDQSVLKEFLNKAYSLATPRELSFLDANKITQHHPVLVRCAGVVLDMYQVILLME